MLGGDDDAADKLVTAHQRASRRIELESTALVRALNDLVHDENNALHGEMFDE